MPPRLCAAVIFAVAVSSTFAAGHALPDPGDVNITIRIVTLENSTRLSLDEQERMLMRIERETSGERRADITVEDISSELGERVRAEYQNRGYFLAELTARLIPVRIGKTSRTYDAVVTVLNEGQQYRLREVHWSGMRVFTEEELLSMMPINPGEIFSRAKVARGLEAARRLYGSKGYINFTSVPDTQIGDEGALVALKIEVDEGRQYTFGDLNLPGLDAAHSRRLLTGWDKEMRGRPASSETLQAFFKRQFLSLKSYPWESEEFTARKLTDKTRTVDYWIRFVPNEIGK
jgi:outer membrane protein insertion porin family